jgi:FkbM family methyltransferase
MSQDNFVKTLLFNIKNNIHDDNLLSTEMRSLRSRYFFGLIFLLNKVINYFCFKNEITFANNKPYIKINDVYFEVVSRYFLKLVNEKYISNADLIIKFLNKFKFKPKIILDVGACWGEFSLVLGKYYNESNIYAIEGSEENYKILCNNITCKLNTIENVKPYNYIVSDSENYKFIKNVIGTVNTVKNDIKLEDSNYSKVKSITLKKFISDKKLTYIDFLKLDIEGHELHLIEDILNINIKYGQIEIININTHEENLNFLERLSNKYELYDTESFSLIDTKELKNHMLNKLNNSVAFDIFIVSKKNFN